MVGGERDVGALDDLWILKGLDAGGSERKGEERGEDSIEEVEREGGKRERGKEEGSPTDGKKEHAVNQQTNNHTSRWERALMVRQISNSADVRRCSDSLRSSSCRCSVTSL